MVGDPNYDSYFQPLPCVPGDPLTGLARFCYLAPDATGGSVVKTATRAGSIGALMEHPRADNGEVCTMQVIFGNAQRIKGFEPNTDSTIAGNRMTWSVDVPCAQCSLSGRLDRSEWRTATR